MTVEITRWQPIRHGGNGIATFNFRIHGVTVRAAMVTMEKGELSVTMPFTRHVQANGNELTAVGLDYADRQAVLAAVRAYHHGKHGERPRVVKSSWVPGFAKEEPDDAGLRRVLGDAERDSLDMAGI